MAYTDTVPDFFHRLGGALDAFEGVEGIVEFTIEGDGGGVWTLDLNAPALDAKDAEGLGKTPTVLLRARPLDFLALVEGRMSPEDGLLTGRLHLAGEAGALAGIVGALSRISEEAHA